MLDLAKIAKNLLFIDIETVSAYGSWDEVPTRMQEFWSKKASYMQNPHQYDEENCILNELGFMPSLVR
jgi:hypothetical protein